MRGLALAALIVPLACTAAACGGHDDPYAGYCAEVSAQQTPLTQALAGGPSTGLLDALPSFEKLQAKAPTDIAADWATIVGRVQALENALDAAGVDPATYDAKHPPSGLTDADRTALDAAAAGLVTSDVTTSLQAVQEEARDVCQTPLTL